MKYVAFAFSALLTLGAFVVLNYSFSGIPPLGKLLSPHHGYLQNAEKDSINLNSEISVSGTREDVIVQFDELLIPHIYAQNDYDLYFAQGYVTAYHRLFQMDLLSYKTAGRLSEILGPNLLDYDRGQRRRGLVLGAEAMLEMIDEDPQMKEVIQAYTDGVNAYIESLSDAQLPLEYKLLNIRPSKWTPLKSCLVAKEMADVLARDEADLQYTNLLALFGKNTMDTLYPETYADIDPVVPGSERVTFDPITVQKPDVRFPLDLTTPFIERANPKNGSNNFVIGPQKTADSAVYFSNEMDLPLSLPSIWYLVHLNAPGCNVLGVSIPGAPFAIVGINDSIAWGFSNAQRDLVDWYKITFKDETRDEYLYDGKWMKTQKTIEEFKIKDQKSYYDTIVQTHIGPVTYDRNFSRQSREDLNLAMRWTGHDASGEYRCFYQLNRARNYDEFRDALSYFSGPPQNMAFASVSGDIGIQVTGKFPLKWEDQGKYLMDGADRSQEWQGMIPYDHMIRMKNPERGFISSANQHPTDDTYPYYTYHYHFEQYRNRRINDRLMTLARVDEEDVMRLQNDNFNYIAFENLPFLLKHLDSLQLNETEQGYADDLREWDFFNEPNLEEPSVFDLWIDELYDRIWDEFDTISVPTVRPTYFNTFRLLRDSIETPFFDKVGTPATETPADLIRESFRAVIDTVDQWKETNNFADLEWYKVKNTTVNHLLRIPQFSVSEVPIGGGSYSVNQATPGHGPSIRLISKMSSSGLKIWGVYPGSQSGNPGNPTYGHMIEYWAGKKYFPLQFSSEPLTGKQVLFESKLLPAK